MRVEISGRCDLLSQDQLLERIKTQDAVKPKRMPPLLLLVLWAKRYWQRRQMARDLTTFTDAVLKDFGLTRQEAERLAHRPFWRD